MAKVDIGGPVLIAAYIAIVVVGEILAYIVGRVIEARVPEWSLIAFLVMFMSVLILAWPLALRLTRSYGPGLPGAA